MRTIYYILFTVWLCSAVYACANDDDFSSDPSLLLQFDSNAISFDTVFATIGSATKQFKIYNKNNKSLTIESIKLRNAQRSGFRMSIDGDKGDLIRNVDIYKKDSLFAFVEVTIDKLSDDSPIIRRDTIEFVTNGNMQTICLEAVGQNVHLWKGKVIDSDTILTANKPYLIYDSLVVRAGVNLKIEAGVKFYFRRYASFQIYGSLDAIGTVKKPIVCRGDRFDYIDGGILYDNVDGQWDGIYFHNTSYNNQLTNFQARNGTRGMFFHESDPLLQKATLMNTIVHNTSQSGMSAINCKIDATNCLFTNSKGATLSVIGGEYTFLHCTIANYYRWSTRQQHALVVSNRLKLKKILPLSKCDFGNSIIYGTAKSEISLEYTNINANDFVYHFDHCLIKGEETNNTNFKDVIWNQDPLFKDMNATGSYIYNFNLTKNSPAIANADKNAALLAPHDLNGKTRINDSTNPDIGCYEAVGK